ncbi:MAG TPA: hypothetical protein VHA06_20485, partial [Candidatus Angelobacter sp.]|nr:hypothetical protein [Candidatus Angelobacter sp.]
MNGGRKGPRKKSKSWAAEWHCEVKSQAGGRKVKKWYNYIVSTDEADSPVASSAATGAQPS